MSGFVKGFLARKYPLTLFNKKLIYIHLNLELWNFLLLSMTYMPFAWNFFGTSGTFFYFQILSNFLGGAPLSRNWYLSVRELPNLAFATLWCVIPLGTWPNV